MILLHRNCKLWLPFTMIYPTVLFLLLILTFMFFTSICWLWLIFLCELDIILRTLWTWSGQLMMHICMAGSGLQRQGKRIYNELYWICSLCSIFPLFCNLLGVLFWRTELLKGRNGKILRILMKYLVQKLGYYPLLDVRFTYFVSMIIIISHLR